ncbi:MAG: hypothetical protein K1X29_04215 [Bdellovibrionales bacterium]|nr:hypothetical protein [Bdellovibrionales bacterium]
MKAFFKGMFFSVILCVLTPPSWSADFEWSGVYRIEGIHLNNAELSGAKNNKDYGLHHLSLRPKIVVGDGVTIHGQMELLNNSTYTNSQLGQTFGGGVNSTPSTPGTDADSSNSLSSMQESNTLRVSQLYLNWVHEYGSLIVGRAPIQFGMGMSYSAGKGLFDHWFDTRDLVGYKIVVGNLFILPMYGKVAENTLHHSDDVVDYMAQVQYENPETDLEIGGFYRRRRSGAGGSDTPRGSGTLGSVDGSGNSTSNSSSMDMSQINIYVGKDTPEYRIAVEAGFLKGDMGLFTENGSGDKVTADGFGLAAELEWRPLESKWKWGLKTGRASGDNPNSTTKYEGFAFNRNYDVALLLFNQSLGRNDVFRTAVWGGGPTTNSGAPPEQTKPDVESLSNVLYFAPYSKYSWNDRWSLTGVLATGRLATNPLSSGASVGKSLGFETDFSLTYTPRKGVEWINQVGILFPGAAFTYNDDKAGMAYAIVSKAAFSF